MVSESEGAPQDMLLQLRMCECQVLHIHVEFGVSIHVEDALIGAARHCRQIPRSVAIVSIDAIKAPLRSAEAKIADEALRDSVGLKPCEICIARLRLETVEELKPSESNIFVGPRVIAKIALLEESCGSVSDISIRCVVGCAEAHLPLSGKWRNGVLWCPEHSWLR